MYYINAFQKTKEEIKKMDLSDLTKERLLETLNKEINEVTICGKNIEEVIQILNGLSIEEMLDIKMTMENLSYLYKRTLDEQYKKEQMIIKSMMFGDDRQ